MKKLWILDLGTSARLSMVGSSLLGGCTADSTEQETEICQIKARYRQPYPAFVSLNIFLIAAFSWSTMVRYILYT
jgi:hypothetical protein